MNTQKNLTALLICGSLLLCSVTDVFSQSTDERVIEVIETESGIQQGKISTPQLRALNSSNGQVPQGFNFQALARGSDGSILTNQNVSVEIKVIQGSESGTVVYTETHDITTNEAGLFQIVIGEGVTSDNFSSVDWSADNYYVGLATDPTGGTNYEELGATRLLSVPYALVAKNVIDGVSVGEVPITEYMLDTAVGDTSFIINAVGPEDLTALRSNAGTDGFNIGISGNALSESSNTSQQRGTQGIASGTGTGTHMGLFGSAVNTQATSGNRIGTWGQAVSQARYNWGAYGIAQGAGDGTIVPIGQENGNVFGSFNIGGGFYSSGNLNGNLGVEGVVSGSAGARINIGVEGRVVATANVPNFGVNGRAFNSPAENVGLNGEASGPEGSVIIGVRGSAYGDGDKFAGMFNGRVQVNGDLNYSGNLNQTSDMNLKENITPLENGLNAVLNLNPTTYNFRNESKYRSMNLSSGTHFGLIAQEVETVLPSLVQTNRHYYQSASSQEAGPNAHEVSREEVLEYKTVNYSELIPVLIKAIQEQQEQIEALEREVKKLRK